MIRLQLMAAFLAAFFMVGCGAVPQDSTTTSTGKPTTTPTTPTVPTDPAPPPTFTPPAGTPPANAKTVSDIQKMPTWGNCSSSCAGEPGTNAEYSMEQGIASPSLTGSAIKFNITGGTPWADALWWKQVGGNDAVTHFIYEMSYYLNDVPAAQALEFNVNQNAGGWRYEYATQCDIRGAGVWRIWDHTAMHWVATSAPCPVPAANTWNKLSWELLARQITRSFGSRSRLMANVRKSTRALTRSPRMAAGSTSRSRWIPMAVRLHGRCGWKAA